MRLLVGVTLGAGLLFGQPEQPIAIVGATVVDGTGAPPRRATVIVRGERIAEVLPAGDIPGTGRVIQAEGHTLLPGFFDLHTHLPYSAISGLAGDWGKSLKAYLYCGVTTAVDFGTYPETFEPMRRLIRERIVSGPRLHLAARMTTPLGHGAEGGRGDFFSLEVQTAREARAAVRRLLAYQPDAIKVFTDGWRYGTAPEMTSMEPETLAAIVEEAHAKGVEVLTHTVTLDKAKIAARAGVDVIAHGVGDALADAELVRAMREKGTTYAPTLAVYERKPRGVWAPLLRTLLEPAAIALVEQSARGRAPAPDPARQARWKNLLLNTALLRGGGIRFGTGTDAGVTGTYHGWSTLREMQLLVAGGLTPLEALTAATGNSAKALRVDGERGTIAAGKLADLVLVEGKPYENIADIERIRRVFLGGREIDRAALARQIAIAAPTPVPARKAQALIDDMEGAEGRTSLGTLRVNATDSGHDKTRMMFGRIARADGGHALAVQAVMADKSRPLAQVALPLSPGGVEPVDASEFRGIQFEARGEGEYRLITVTRAVRDGQHFAARFRAGAAWGRVQIPFSSLKQERSKAPAAWTGKDLLGVLFEISRQPGQFGWLELDNVRFY